MMLDFYDDISKRLALEVPERNAVAKLMLTLENLRIGQGYVTAKVENRYGDMVNINIQPGAPGISFNESLVNLKRKEASMVYLITSTKNKKTIVRKLPFTGFTDWVLIFEETLFMEAVKDGCDEMEMFLV
jgi:hypothetical protein